MKPFPPDKTATELGCKIGQKFVVVSEVNGDYYKKGDIIEFIYDDGSYDPKFKNLSTNEKIYACWCFLAPYNPEQKNDLELVGFSLPDSLEREAEKTRKKSAIVEWLYVHDGGYPNKLKWREDFINFLDEIL